MTNPYALDVSWELYQRFPITICRPAYAGYLGEGKPLLRVEVDWTRSWPAKESFAPELPSEMEGPALLVPIPTRPAWAAGGDLSAFLRLLGARLSGGEAFAGALLERDGLTGDDLRTVLRAYRAGFDRTTLIARVHDAPLIDALRREEIPFGLLLEAGHGVIAIREALADQGLQRVWEKAPVFLEAQGSQERREDLLACAAFWHVLAADLPGIRPGRLALRRLTYPQKVTSGGALPLRFWWQVVGDSPLYGTTKIRLLLKAGDAQWEIPLGDERPLRPMGDHTHHQIAGLPPLPTGDYEVWCGAFGETVPLPLSMREPCQDGFFKAGEITVDQEPRPELLHAWDGFEPEGYYPLEDPKLPY